MLEPERFEIPILGSVLCGVPSLIGAQTCTIVSSTPEPSGECRFIAPENTR
jgi:hypothetical protein